MPPGIRGHLLAGAVIEERVAASVASGGGHPCRDLAAWRARWSSLGPASTTRSLLQAAAAPLGAILGFEPPAAIAALGGCLSCSLRGAAQAVTLIVAPWAEPLD